MTSRDQVTVVLPTLNESEAIGLLIGQIRDAGYAKVLVVDGYSTDLTQEIAKAMGAEVIGQRGEGKAGAILVARDRVVTLYFVVMDADGTYDPRDIDRLIAHSEWFDEVIGARPRGTPNMSRLHKLGNRILTSTFNVLLGSNLPDVASGMYLLRTRRVREMIFDRGGFEIDQEVAAQSVVSGRVTSVPIDYRKRIGRAKAPTWRQGFRALFAVFGIARKYNAPVLYGLLAGAALVPAAALLSAFAVLLLDGMFHSGYLLAGLVFLAIGGQGLTVAVIGHMLRRMERRLSGQG